MEEYQRWTRKQYPEVGIFFRDPAERDREKMLEGATLLCKRRAGRISRLFAGRGKIPLSPPFSKGEVTDGGLVNQGSGEEFPISDCRLAISS